MPAVPGWAARGIMEDMAADTAGHPRASGEASRRGDYTPPVGVLRIGPTSLPVVSPARVYVCGITPYDVTHVGHAATFVWADAVAKIIKSTGAAVITCRNVTDVDDVLTSAAEAHNRYYDEYAATQEFMFDRTMRALAVAAPTQAPRAGNHIGHAIELAAALLDVGAAYPREGWVYFRGEEVPAAWGVSPDDALSLLEEYGDHPDDPLRDNPLDVPVWRPSTGQDPAWPSPWGPGRPGWHCECAAMAMSVLGPCIDLLVGGADLFFPHHAYQSAMVQAASGSSRFARAELAVGTVMRQGRKMAKSTGNLVLVDDLLERVTPQVLRLHLLDRPWSQPWEFVASDLQASEARWERLRSAAGRPSRGIGADEALRALLHNLDVPEALDLAEESGGAAAEKVLHVLSLDSPAP